MKEEISVVEDLKLLKILGIDVDEYARDMDSNDTPRARRSYVRAAFAYIEGACLFMRRKVIIELRKKESTWATIGKLMVASESQFVTSSQGEVKERTLRLDTSELLLFSLQEFLATFGLKASLERNGSQWRSYQEALKIRHGLTHPKQVGDVILTDKQISCVKEAIGLIHMYFFLATNEPCREFIQSKIAELQSTTAENPDDETIQFTVEDDDLRRFGWYD